MEIKDSGSTREFETGAHRDNADGKGRCDLVPGLYAAQASVAIDDMAFDAIGLFSPTTMNDCGEEEVNPYYVDLLNYAVYQGFSALSDKNNFACLILNVIAATAIAEGIRTNMASRDVAITSDDVDDCDAFAKKMYWYGIMQVSKHYEEGGKKYGYNNWKKGMQTHVYYDSMLRHLTKANAGMEDEPHIRAACWNALCLLWTFNNQSSLNDLVFDEEYR